MTRPQVGEFWRYEKIDGISSTWYITRVDPLKFVHATNAFFGESRGDFAVYGKIVSADWCNATDDRPEMTTTIGTHGLDGWTKIHGRPLYCSECETEIYDDYLCEGCRHL